jgi:hypothetical protein
MRPDQQEGAQPLHQSPPHPCGDAGGHVNGHVGGHVGGWSLPHVAERCTRDRGLSAGLGASVGRREETSEALLQTGGKLTLGALGLDHRLEMDPELQLVGARTAPGQVTLHLRADDVVHFMVEETLDLSERFLALGPAVIHRQVPVP